MLAFLSIIAFVSNRSHEYARQRRYVCDRRDRAEAIRRDHGAGQDLDLNEDLGQLQALDAGFLEGCRGLDSLVAGARPIKDRLAASTTDATSMGGRSSDTPAPNR